MPSGHTPPNVSASVSLIWMRGCDDEYISALNAFIIYRMEWHRVQIVSPSSNGPAPEFVIYALIFLKTHQ